MNLYWILNFEVSRNYFEIFLFILTNFYLLKGANILKTGIVNFIQRTVHSLDEIKNVILG